MRTYKVRQFKNGRAKSDEPFINYSLTLPTPLADKMIEQFGYVPEFQIDFVEPGQLGKDHPGGVLYRPVEPGQPIPDQLPFKPGKRADNGTQESAEKATAPKAAPKPAAPKKAASKPTAKAAPKPKAAAPKAPSAPKAAPKRPSAPRAPKAAK